MRHELLELRKRLPDVSPDIDCPRTCWPCSSLTVASYVGALHRRAHCLGALTHGAEVHGRERVVEWEVCVTTVGASLYRTNRRSYEARSLLLTCRAPGRCDFVPSLRHLARPQRQVLLWTQPKTLRTSRSTAFRFSTWSRQRVAFMVSRVTRFLDSRSGSPTIGMSGWIQTPSIGTAATEDEAVLRDGLRRYFPDADGPTLAMKAACSATHPTSTSSSITIRMRRILHRRRRLFRSTDSSSAASSAKSSPIWLSTVARDGISDCSLGSARSAHCSIASGSSSKRSPFGFITCFFFFFFFFFLSSSLARRAHRAEIDDALVRDETVRAGVEHRVVRREHGARCSSR